MLNNTTSFAVQTKTNIKLLIKKKFPVYKYSNIDIMLRYNQITSIKKKKFIFFFKFCKKNRNVSIIKKIIKLIKNSIFFFL